MSRSVEFELDRIGVAELLHSEELKAVLEAEARRRNPGTSGYEVDSYNAGTRVVAKIQASSSAAIRDNLKNNTLLKALGRK